MAMRWGAHTFGYVWQENAEEALAAVGEAGFRHVELMATPPHFDPWSSDPDRTRRLRSVLDRYGLDLVAADLASSDVNLASPSPDVVAFSVDAYGRLVERCHELGARAVCVGSGRRHALLAHVNDRLMESFRPAFRTIVALAARRGLRVLLENHPQGLLAEAPAIRRFLEEEGCGTGVIYDVANAAAAGEDPCLGIDLLRRHIGVIHLSDTKTGAWRHDPIGAGDLDFAAIGRALDPPTFDGIIVLETMSVDATRSLVEGRRRLMELSGSWC